jgi:hypothetical protein
MNMNAKQESVVKLFARGQLPWKDLRSLGIDIHFMDDGCDVDGKGAVVETPSIGDVATGLLRHVRASERNLREWAAVMLAASQVIDLSELEESEDGEALLDALWKASAGQEIEESILTVARAHAAPH